LSARVQAFLFIAICSVLFAASEARAQCTCTPVYVDITARGEFNLAYAVFVGKVVASENTPTDKDNRSVQTVTFEVMKAWKHDLNATLTITNEIYGCINRFKINEEWLAYVYKKNDGSFETYCCCSRTRLAAKADEDLKTFADDPPAKVLRSNIEP